MEELEQEKKDHATIQLKPRGPVTLTGSIYTGLRWPHPCDYYL